MSSSLISGVKRQRPLVEVFADVPDPRARRGRRHRLAVVLTLAASAVLAGCSSFLAIGEHVQDLSEEQLARLGVDPKARRPRVSTIRRVLSLIDALDFDSRLGAWLETSQRPEGEQTRRKVLAVDGKTLRGSRTATTPARRLIAAVEHASGIVLGQQAIDTNSNEIPALRELLAGIDITDAVITADALHTQQATAAWIINHGGHYLLTVKNNQPGLREQLNSLPWAPIPSHTTTETSHGRRSTRTLKAVQAPDWITFPAAAQVLQLRRTRTRRGRRHSEVVYLICSLPMTQATTSEITTWAQGHWRIESLHWIRDVVFNEDHHQARTGNGPQIMASLRNLAINLIRLFHGPTTSITTHLRHHARHPNHATKLLVTTPQPRL